MAFFQGNLQKRTSVMDAMAANTLRGRVRTVSAQNDQVLDQGIPL